jgi:hypothetical protein
MPRPADGVHSRLSGDGPKVLGLLRGLPGACWIGAWNKLEGCAIGKVDMLMSGIDARAYWFHCCDSTVDDGNGVK